MIPKTEIRFSFIYAKKFNPDFTLQDFSELKENCKDFLKAYEENIKKILELISTNNTPWIREYIPIYIVSGKIKSFSDPLTLNYKENHKLLLLIMIHELIHNNLIKKYKNTIELHKEIDKIYQKVLNDLKLSDFGEAKKEYNRKYRGF